MISDTIHEQASTASAIDRPSHYVGADGLEAIDVLEAATGLEMHLPTALTYVLRHRHKGRPAEDLAKARWYVGRVLAARGRPARQPAIPFDYQLRAANSFGLDGPARDAFLAILDALVAAADDRRTMRLRDARRSLDRAIAALGGSVVVPA